MTGSDATAPVDGRTPHPVWDLACRAGRGIRWYMTNLMGDTAYQTYVDHHRRSHPGEAPMTEREFWRDKMDEQDRNPGARCC